MSFDVLDDEAVGAGDPAEDVALSRSLVVGGDEGAAPSDSASSSDDNNATTTVAAMANKGIATLASHHVQWWRVGRGGCPSGPAFIASRALDDHTCPLITILDVGGEPFVRRSTAWRAWALPGRATSHGRERRATEQASGAVIALRKGDTISSRAPQGVSDMGCRAAIMGRADSAIGRPRIRPDVTSGHLRSRGIKAVIPESDDQKDTGNNAPVSLRLGRVDGQCAIDRRVACGAPVRFAAG